MHSRPTRQVRKKRSLAQHGPCAHQSHPEAIFFVFIVNAHGTAFNEIHRAVQRTLLHQNMAALHCKRLHVTGQNVPARSRRSRCLDPLGGTTQDIMDSATVLQIRAGYDLIAADLRAIITALAAQADSHRNIVMAGRTHLQHALPVTFGLKCAIWLMPLLDHLHRIVQLRPRIERLQFGGAVGTLASLGADGPAVIAGLAAELRLAAPLAPWHVARDGMAEAVGVLGLVCGSLAKIATDVILMAQSEIGELSEPYVPGRGQSSTMPQKRNPIASEYILAAARQVQALVPVMQGAMAQDHERATGPWQAEMLALPQAFVLTHGAVLHARAIAEGMVVDAGRMRQNLDVTGGLIVAEAVMMGLAPMLGRDAAHHVVKHACDRALSERIPLAAALALEPEVTARLDAAAIARMTDPATYLGSTQLFITQVLAAAHS